LSTISAITLRDEQQDIPLFSETLREHQLGLNRKLSPSTAQINLGKLCNLACHHCHVDAGPKRTEIMTWQTMERILQLLENSPGVECIDLTGGAPEMNPHFRELVHKLPPRYRIIDRCNLTVMFEPGQEDLAEFLAEQQIEVVASLPCYSQDNVDTQRGKGSFDKSIRALQQLNQLGYGKHNSPLQLNLVYNPVGAHLPPDQATLENDYKKRLREDFDIEFNNLLTITNIPIKRFAHQLQNEQALDSYRQTLYDNFNPVAAEHIMCRDLISISWDGKLYDCDFNQMLEMPFSSEPGKSIQDIWQLDSFNTLDNQNIATGQHCYACTAGSGSSCSGALTE